MAFLSKRIMIDVNRSFNKKFGIKRFFIDLAGKTINPPTPLDKLSNSKRRRMYALQQSIDQGQPYIFYPAPSIASWAIGLENKRMVHGMAISDPVIVLNNANSTPDLYKTAEYLQSKGMSDTTAQQFINNLPVLPESKMKKAADALYKTFYNISGWKPVLSEENKLRAHQKMQFQQAIQTQKQSGQHALYAFEKERYLLANIRAGNRNEARRVLNEMLAAIFLSTPKIPILRARTIELITCLTRAAIEDNPLLEPLIERNHIWIEKIIAAKSFDTISTELINDLDEFIDEIYLHGVNRSNIKVHDALEYINTHFNENILLQDVAEHINLSPYRISHLIKDYTGRTMLQHIQEIRTHHARRLLKETNLSCTEIAYKLGYSDQSYFIKHFKRQTGTTPAKYRRNIFSGKIIPE